MAAIDITGYRYVYSNGTFTERIKSIRFGNGLEQRMSDGINTLRHSWEVSFAAIKDPDGAINNNLNDLLNALLSADVLFWISPYDLVVAKSSLLIGFDLQWGDLDDAQVDLVKRKYVVDGSVSYEMLNDNLTNVKCVLRRFYG